MPWQPALGTQPLAPFDHQVAGQSSMLRYDKTTVCKPLIAREHFVYKSLPPELAEFTPEYRGEIEVQLIEEDGYIQLYGLNVDEDTGDDVWPGAAVSDSHDHETTSGAPKGSSKDTSMKNRSTVRLLRSGSYEVCASTNQVFYTADSNPGQPHTHSLNPWSLKNHKRLLDKMRKSEHSHDKIRFILLKNVVADFCHPCILDLKIGSRLHGDDASSIKVASQSDKCQRTTSSTLGVRLCGMQVYQVDSKAYHSVDKYHGRTLNDKSFRRLLYDFLHNGTRFRSELIQPIVSRLSELIKCLKGLHSFRFYASSLLIIYDGDPGVWIGSQNPKIGGSKSCVTAEVASSGNKTEPSCSPKKLLKSKQANFGVFYSKELCQHEGRQQNEELLSERACPSGKTVEGFPSFKEGHPSAGAHPGQTISCQEYSGPMMAPTTGISSDNPSYVGQLAGGSRSRKVSASGIPSDNPISVGQSASVSRPMEVPATCIPGDNPSSVGQSASVSRPVEVSATGIPKVDHSSVGQSASVSRPVEVSATGIPKVDHSCVGQSASVSRPVEVSATGIPKVDHSCVGQSASVSRPVEVSATGIPKVDHSCVGLSASVSRPVEVSATGIPKVDHSCVVQSASVSRPMEVPATRMPGDNPSSVGQSASVSRPVEVSATGIPKVDPSCGGQSANVLRPNIIPSQQYPSVPEVSTSGQQLPEAQTSSSGNTHVGVEGAFKTTLNYKHSDKPVQASAAASPKTDSIKHVLDNNKHITSSIQTGRIVDTSSMQTGRIVDTSSMQTGKIGKTSSMQAGEFVQNSQNPQVPNFVDLETHVCLSSSTQDSVHPKLQTKHAETSTQTLPTVSVAEVTRPSCISSVMPCENHAIAACHTYSAAIHTNEKLPISKYGITTDDFSQTLYISDGDSVYNEQSGSEVDQSKDHISASGSSNRSHLSNAKMMPFENCPASNHMSEISHSYKNSVRVDVKMIDFAHTTHQGFMEDKIKHSGPDTDYIFGLKNLMTLFQELPGFE